MKSFGNLSLEDGCEISNLTIDSGPTFPVGGIGELFYYTGMAQEVGLYMHSGAAWVLTVVHDDKFATKVKFVMSARYCIYGGSTQQTVSSTSPMSVQLPTTIFAEAMAAPVTGTADKIVFAEDGLYEISYATTLLGGNSAYETYLALNNLQIQRTSTFGNTQSNATDKTSFSGIHILPISAGQDIRLMARRYRGSGSATLTGADTKIIIRKIK